MVTWPLFQLRNVLPPSHMSCAFVNFDEDPRTTQSTRVGTRSANHKAFPAPSTFGISQMPLVSHKGDDHFVDDCSGDPVGCGKAEAKAAHPRFTCALGSLLEFSAWCCNLGTKTVFSLALHSWFWSKMYKKLYIIFLFKA